MTTTWDFYRQLPVYSSVEDLLLHNGFRALPEDWSVIMTDVEGSTQAIERGEYRHVVLLGASSIIAVLNVFPDVEFPFAFGGDGAFLCVPSSKIEIALDALHSIKRIAERRFRLGLRIGVVPAAEIRAAGHDLLVGKYLLSEHNSLAVLSGGGFDYVDAQVKSGQRVVDRAPGTPRQPSLDGLECRWEPVACRRGSFASLVVKPLRERERFQEVLVPLLRKMEEIYGRDRLERPVDPEMLRLAFRGKYLRSEILARSKDGIWGRGRYALRLRLLVLLGAFLMKFGVRVRSIDWGGYKGALARNTDNQKLADMYTHVFSGERARHERLEAYLEEQFQLGNLVYGISYSDEAIFTCYVTRYAGKHLHFLDGGTGGLTLAAQELKARLGSRTSTLADSRKNL